MADKVTLDFENGKIIWDTDAQTGVENCPDLAERKPQILAAMGYETVDFSSTVDAINAFVNGQIDQDEFLHRCDTFTSDDK